MNYNQYNEDFVSYSLKRQLLTESLNESDIASDYVISLDEFGQIVAKNVSYNFSAQFDYISGEFVLDSAVITLQDENKNNYTFVKKVDALTESEAKYFALAFEDYINSGEEPDGVYESLTEAVEDPFETLIDNVYEVIEYEHLWAELTDRRVTGDKLKLAYEVNGDWKHEHLRFSNCIMPKCCEDLGLVIEKHWESDVEDNDSDTYWSIHNFVISKGRGLRNVQQSL